MPTIFEDAVLSIQLGRDVTEVAEELYAELDDGERLWLLDGDTDFWEGLARFRSEGYNREPIVHGAVDRLGLPGTRFVDGPRGCVAGAATAFPVSMARGATWDVSLEEQVGDVIGREIRALGGNFFGGVCINLPRHPAWGRAQETYGDDPYHLGEFGAALTRGTQRWVMACAKHYALNSMENARFTVDVTADEPTLHDVYLPHFERVAEQGVAAVMGAYNSVNGEWCGQNEYLLTTVLRDMWGWDGITVTDFIWGLRDAAASLNAGMDLEEPFRQQRAQYLADQLQADETSWAMVARAGVRLITAQLRSYVAREHADPPAQVVANDEARALARTVAARAMVLLKNEPVGDRPVLPLDPRSVRSIALIGRLADAANMGDHGSSDVRPPSAVTPLEGIRAAFPDAEVRLVEIDDVAAAAEAAAGADVAIVVAGYDAQDEGEYIGPDSTATPELLSLFPPIPDDMVRVLGEAFAPGEQSRGMGGDRASLSLRPVDEEIIRAVAAANPSTVVAVVAAGAVLTEGWRAQVPAVRDDVVRRHGGRSRSGRRADGGAQPERPSAVLHPHLGGAPAVLRPRGHRHHVRPLPRPAPAGQARRARRLPARLRPLLHDVRRARRVVVDSVEEDAAALTVEVANTGGRDGIHVVQVYGRSSAGPYAGELFLAGFAPVSVPAGSTTSVSVPVSLRPLAAWDAGERRRVLPEPGRRRARGGSHAHDPAAVVVRLASA